jgi:transcriptional regulator with XRE-family HTH domain
MPDGADLGASVRSLRKQKKLTIEELAHIVDIHTTYLSKIERGRGNPSWKIIIGFADAFDLSLVAFAQYVEGITRAREGYELVVQDVEKRTGLKL